VLVCTNEPATPIGAITPPVPPLTAARPKAPPLVVQLRVEAQSLLGEVELALQPSEPETNDTQATSEYQCDRPIRCSSITETARREIVS
jgi:hypothetical protein